MPILMTVTILAAISLAGFGPLLSFIGKELLFEALLETERFGPVFIAGAVLSAAVSVAVALILIIRPFFGALKPTPHEPHEAPLRLWLGPAILALLGIALGLFPASISATLVAPASGAILREPQEVKLALWHGFNLALGLSAISITLGLVFYSLWAAWRRTATWLADRLTWGPERMYNALIEGLTRIAEWLTSVLQTGHLHDYIVIIVATTVGLTGYTLLNQGGQYWVPRWLGVRFYEVILAILILGAALTVVRSQSRLVAVAALGIVGYGVSMIFVLFGAPDLAMTQILVETVTVILLVLILYHLPGFSRLTSTAARTRDAIIALAAGALMTSLVLIANTAVRVPSISLYYLENSVPLAHGRNIVNAILVDFRGLDTLGEITVLSLAAIGVFALLKLRWRGR